MQGSKRSLIASFFHHKRPLPSPQSQQGDTPSLTDAQLAAIITLEQFAEDRLALTNLDQNVFREILESTHWDCKKAMIELTDYQEADHRLLTPPPTSSETKLLGAENDGYTSCYIDSLIFAMFISLTFFDPLLTYNIPDGQEPKQKLQLLLRLVVNKLRKGHLVKAEIIGLLRKALEEASWSGRNLQGAYSQEDASELFMFLTETFNLPYLPFQIRLFHGASSDKDDDRVMTDRVLALSIPAKRSTIKLEDILVDHFYNNIVTGIHRQVDPALPSSPASAYSMSEKTVTLHDRSQKEMPVTAWQVLELLPFYSGMNEQGEAIEVQAQGAFPETHMILPMMLKRYSYDDRNRCIKLKRSIQIPSTIHFSEFVNRNADDPLCTTCGQKIECLLRLQSAVCHKGESLQSGHYVAYARVQQDGQESWLKLDDLDTTRRVRSFSKKQISTVYNELAKDAYILFYELSAQCHHDRSNLSRRASASAGTSGDATNNPMDDESPVPSRARPVSAYGPEITASKEDGDANGGHSARLSCTLL